jgi:hypothetical protein
MAAATETYLSACMFVVQLISRPASLRSGSIIKAMTMIFGGSFVTFTICILVCGKQNIKSIQMNMSEVMLILGLW